MPGSMGHLTSRFFDVLLAKPLDATEVEELKSWLPNSTGELFFSQPISDQRHGYHAAATVIGLGQSSADVVAAAALHDIGKRHANLGTAGRVVASLFLKLHLPLTSRFRVYRDHGLVAAEELARAGASRLVVEFAMHHHAERPASIDKQNWDALQIADRAPNPRSMRLPRIISGTG